MRRLPALAVFVGLVLAGAGACTDGGSSRAAGRLSVDGRAEVTTVDGDRTVVTRNRTLHSGDQVRVLDGKGVLGLGNGRQLELRRNSVVRLGAGAATANGAAVPRGELVSGDVLVTAATEPATVVVGSTEVTVTTGVARISRSLAVVTAVYEGAAGVATAGRSASVPALRQVTVPAPGLPSPALPLVYSPSDSWDQRYLGEAMDLSNQLVARSRGFSAQLATGEGTTPGFYRQLLPALNNEPFDASLFESGRAPGETLVGAAITLAGAKDTFVSRWANVFAFHADGAPWGLVALDQKVGRSSALTIVDDAINRRAGPAEQAAPAATTATTVPAGRIPVPVPTTAVPSGSGGTGTTVPSTGPTTVPATSPTTAAPATGSVPGSERGPVDLGVPLVDDTLNDVIDLLGGLLGSLGK